MIKKIGGFFEAHVEKIILIIVGLLCSWLLITRVLLTPNIVEYKGKNYSPGNIDVQILEDVRQELRKNPEATELIPPGKRNFDSLFTNSLSDVDFEFNIKPQKSDVAVKQIFPQPVISKIKVTDPEIEYIRSVAYEPKEEITRNNPYAKGDCEPNDLDFVTVSGNIDIKSIVQELEKCYINGVDRELQDPCNSKPIFAQVNLQRQRLLPNGQWSDWENVSRTKIDENKDLFGYKDSYSDLRLGGYEIYKYQLNHMITQMKLLQPEPYQIATANEEWLPPKLHRDFVDALKRDEKETQRRDSLNSTTTSSTVTGGRRGSRNNTGGINTTTTNTGGRRSSRRGSTGTTDYNTNTQTRRGSRGSTQNETVDDTTYEQELFVNDVYDEYETVFLTYNDDLTKRSDPILFWAHDDTVQPDNTYRYRIRVGLLNPVVQSENDPLIYWSSFSDVTDQVFIRGKMYFFAGEVQEAAKTVSVSVYKLHLGYWYKKVFDRVAQGEMIGSIAEVEQKEPASTTTGRITDSDEEELEMVTVDFTTGAIMVDVKPASEWTGGSSMNPVPYHIMMYTYDEKEILQMPATRTPNPNIWPRDLYDAYNFVQGHINDRYEELQPWGSSEIDFENARIGQFNERTLYR